MSNTLAYVTFEAFVPDRLPKGPHGLSRDQVQASQRTRMLDAVLEVVGEHGFRGATVAHVTSRAKVSRNAFYEQFSDLEDCFLAGYDRLGEQFWDELVEVAGTVAELPEAITACSYLIVDWVLARPLATRAFHLEIYAAGERGLQRRDRAVALGEEIFRQAAVRARKADPSLPPPHPLITRAVIAASFELTSQALRNVGDSDGEVDVAAVDAILPIWLIGLTGREEISSPKDRSRGRARDGRARPHAQRQAGRE